MTRPLHDWTSPVVIAKLREMTRLGFSPRSIAFVFGYATPSGLLGALKYPGCEAAVQALTEGYVEAERERLMVAHAALKHEDPRIAMAAAKWLDDKAEKGWAVAADAPAERPALPSANFTDAELLATLRPGELQ